MRRLRELPWLRVLLFGAAYLVLATAGGMLRPRRRRSRLLARRRPVGRRAPAGAAAPLAPLPGHVAVSDLALYTAAGASPLLAGGLRRVRRRRAAARRAPAHPPRRRRRARLDSPARRAALHPRLRRRADPGRRRIGGSALWLAEGGALADAAHVLGRRRHRRADRRPAALLVAATRSGRAPGARRLELAAGARARPSPPGGLRRPARAPGPTPRWPPADPPRDPLRQSRAARSAASCWRRLALVLTGEGRGRVRRARRRPPRSTRRSSSPSSAPRSCSWPAAPPRRCARHPVAADGLREATEVRRRFERIVSVHRRGRLHLPRGARRLDPGVRQPGLGRRPGPRDLADGRRPAGGERPPRRHRVRARRAGCASSTASGSSRSTAS